MQSKCAIGGLLLSMLATPVLAVCPAPGAAPKPPAAEERPEPPSCVADNSCDNASLDAYSNAVAAYVRKLEDYVFAAEKYAADAQKYAACEADAARETLAQ